MKEIGKASRREFIVATAAVGACMCGMNGCFFPFSSAGSTPRLRPPAYDITGAGQQFEIAVDTAQAPDLLKKGYAAKVKDDRIKDSIIIANMGGDDFVALSIFCTHNGYEVEYQPDLKTFKCISINRAEFGTDGHVVNGPTRQPLAQYPIRREDAKLIVTVPA